MSTDLTFITNEDDQTLKSRFEVLTRDARFFDCLVGYFYTSGFLAIAGALEGAERIRILIGISTDRRTLDLVDRSFESERVADALSHAEAKEGVEREIEKEFEQSEDSRAVEEGVERFIEWIHSGKLQIRAYPSDRIHAKVYIMTFAEGDRDSGRVITGSSNFTQAGLIDNLEFNVELKTRADYEFARRKFEALWEDSVELSVKYVEAIRTKTWLNQTITPYELYLKFLYEYFKEELGLTDEVWMRYLPESFKKLEYQEQAVLNSKKILEEYGGVFISDVVGLGKTYISAMLAGQLDGRSLVLAPPVLLNKNNPGSWPNVFTDFRVHAEFESIGKLDDLLKKGVEKYANIIVDEAHRFRTESNLTYEKLAEICRGKRVILVTATPYNNSPSDILSQIKLFQNARRSTIPNLPNLEQFFAGLDKKLKRLDRQKDHGEYIRRVKENAREIRDKVLRYLMVRRTRSEISRYFSEDLKKQGLKFPDVEAPVALYYELDDHEDRIFNRTIELATQSFKYARYTPLLYLKETRIDQLERQSQENMGKFMKILLVKRLESSFHAFKNTVDRFIRSYELFIDEFDKGNVYVSKKHAQKVFELLESDDDDAVQGLIDAGKAQRYEASQFRVEFRADLEQDLLILSEIKSMWQPLIRDPKLLSFFRQLDKNPLLRESKLIVFTESKETANYLCEQIDSQSDGGVLCFTGASGEAVRDRVIENFDARVRQKKDEYRILVCTEVLSEGVNLHRSNVVVNYDIPWNPTRMMQRVGRINRVDTPFDRIYTFNFFPTTQSNSQIRLQEVAESKINAFLTLLGGDAALLTEGEPLGSHELFNRLLSVKTVTGEDDGEESELKYLAAIREVRDKDPQLFEKIKRLPKKARTARMVPDQHEALVTYFRRGKIQKFFVAQEEEGSRELDFISAARLLEVGPEAELNKPGSNYYALLDRNKEAFLIATTEEIQELRARGSRDSASQALRVLKAVLKDRRQLTEDQEDYVKKVMAKLEEGALPKQTTRAVLASLNDLEEALHNPLKVVGALRAAIPTRLLEGHFVDYASIRRGRREVILSEYLAGV